MNSLRLPQRQLLSFTSTTCPPLPVPLFQKLGLRGCVSSSGRGLCAARSLLQDLSPSPSAPRPLDLDLLVSSRDPLESEIGWRTSFAEDFDVCSQIGAGGFGSVFCGQHKMSGQQYAVKMMSKVRGKQSRASSIRAINREAQLMRLVQACPGVAALVDCYEDANGVQLITDLCRGGDLRRHVEVHGALDEASLAGVALEVLLVLQACHQQNIVYADVKPANFCLADAGQGPCNIRAVDFGCSQRLGPSSRSSKRTGTLAFMAPETFNRDFGFKADVWGLGISLYWMYALRLPFWSITDTPRAPTLDDMVKAVQNAPITFDYGPWLQLSPEGLDFMSGCLQRCEGERMSVEQALQHPWIKRMQEGKGESHPFNG